MIKFFLILSFFFSLFFAQAEEGWKQCQNELVKKGFNKYTNKYSDSFSIYHLNNIFYFGLKNSSEIYSNDSNVINQCESKTKIDPLEKIVLISSTLVEGFIELNENQKIVGIGEKKYIYDSDKKLPNAEDLGTIPSIEKIIQLKPNIIIGYDSPALKSLYSRLETFGFPILFINDYEEDHPLGRAELRIIIGALFGKINASKNQFDLIEKNYFDLKKTVDKKVKVLLGDQLANGPWKKISPRADFFKIVSDAGGIDLLSNFQSDYLNPEEILKKMPEAKIWLPQNSLEKLDQVSGRSTFMNLLVKNSEFRIVTYGKRVSQNGGAEYWDRALMRPDLLLADLIKVLGSSSLKNKHELIWYRELR